MEEFKGTKGDWKVKDRTFNDSSGHFGHFAIENDSCERAAEVYPYERFGMSIDRATSNAKLIAASPVLLESLQESTKVLESILALFEDSMSMTTKFGIDLQIQSNKKAIEKALK